MLNKKNIISFLLSCGMLYSHAGAFLTDSTKVRPSTKEVSITAPSSSESRHFDQLHIPVSHTNNDPILTPQQIFDSVGVKKPSDRDTTRVRSANQRENCATYIKTVSGVYNIGRASTEVVELKNGLVYVHGQGIVNLKNGQLYKLSSSTDREQILQLLGDSILCIRLANIQHIFNLRSEYQYHKKQWVTTTFSKGVVESYNTGIVPVFENDSTALICDLKANRILERLTGNGAFFRSVAQTKTHFYLANKHLYKINLINGKKELDISLAGLGSNIIVEDNQIVLWDRSLGVIAHDMNTGQNLWQHKSNDPLSYVKLMADNEQIYFNDGKVRAVGKKSGKLLWSDTSGEAAVRIDNISLIGNYLITGVYYDSDAVIVLIDKTTGKIVCDGKDMENETGYYRYIFFKYVDDNTFYGLDGGGDNYRIVKFELSK